MAEVIDFQFSSAYRNAENMYPWDEWLDGRAWKLVEGEDFSVQRATMSMSVRTAARLRGGNVRVSLTQPGALVVKFWKD